MSRVLISAIMTLIVVVTPAGCHFAPSAVTGGAADAPPDDPTSNACMQACAWGCILTPQPHCGALVPAGGVVPGDLDGGINATIATSIDTGDGMNMKPKIDGVTWTDFHQVNNVTIFRVKTMHLTGNVMVTGKLGLAIVASGDVIFDGVLDGTGCDPAQPIGGFIGGTPHMDAMGSGAGQGSDGQDSDSGGGGGNGGAGGTGGDNQSGGPAYGANDPGITHLAGGGGGGGGVGMSGPNGGNGGAAIQIISNTMLTMNLGGINAGGCGGVGSGDKSGGGGGAGGTILLEAPHVTIGNGAALAVNGGGGGAAVGAGGTRIGAHGSLDRTPAPGGTGTVSGSLGAAGATTKGMDAITVVLSGGAGGGIGRIRINTASGIAAVTGTLSPDLSDQTTCTQGTAVVQ